MTTILPEEQAEWEITIEPFCFRLIRLMENDGDFGPEWATQARKVLADMQDFIYYDEERMRKYDS